MEKYSLRWLSNPAMARPWNGMLLHEPSTSSTMYRPPRIMVRSYVVRLVSSVPPSYMVASPDHVPTRAASFAWGSAGVMNSVHLSITSA
jgi:hypothetical protein